MATPLLKHVQAQLIQFPAPSTDDLLERKLSRYLELKEAAKEYEALKKELKAVFENEAFTQVGPYVITGKPVTRKAYSVPETTYWHWEVATV